ncbi:RusA family crossover junction endodeoxyribonuclease [Shewanella sp. KX20019]|uniref:RusA family crossover junction endodeoxyribonuclease n=1 Tax=Shewanella sp. KX20019 TaxID=2803864 RepID=UPI001927A5A1|nr:RusA family crossover junction endodeoxyribonuclease [Shewanella sp. KX20019]QQX80838.1 RusA family crossover junction endodeoxyribonuclease [Shewanella sp. KX20019]
MDYQQLVFDYPLTVNKIYRNFKGRIVLTPKAKEYKAKVVNQLKRAIKIGYHFPYNEQASLQVEYWLYAPDNRRRDLANLDKLLSDAITEGGLWPDDSQIDDHRFIRGYIAGDDARVEIYITEIPPGYEILSEIAPNPLPD